MCVWRSLYVCVHESVLTKLLSMPRSYREVKDRDEINDFLRSEIRLHDMREKVEDELTEGPRHADRSKDKQVDVLLQREQTIQELQKLLESACLARDNATTELE